jgi:hypothetical protein
MNEPHEQPTNPDDTWRLDPSEPGIVRLDAQEVQRVLDDPTLDIREWLKEKVREQEQLDSESQG